MRNVQKKGVAPALPVRTRVRLEFTAVPRGKTIGFQVDKKITALRVLMSERFGADGLRTFEDWLLYCAADQNSTDLRKTWGGGGNT